MYTHTHTHTRGRMYRRQRNPFTENSEGKPINFRFKPKVKRPKLTRVSRYKTEKGRKRI